MTLTVELARQTQEARLAGAIVQPQDADHFVGPAVFCPLVQRALREMSSLVREIALDERNDSGVAGGFLVLRERLEHHDVGPPVLVFRRANRTVGPLMGQGPVDPPVGLGDEFRVAQQESERYKSVHVISAALPALAHPDTQSAVRPA